MIPVVLLSLLVLGAGAAAAQTSTLQVAVRTAQGQPIPGATVALVDVGRRAETDADGVARFADLPFGVYTLDVRRVGYDAARTQVVVALPEHQQAVVLRARPLRLAPLVVQGRARRGVEMLRARGFFERQRMRQGIFITREQIERLRPRLLSDLLRQMAPGVRITSTPFMESRAAMARSVGLARCPIQFFIDGVPAYAFNIDDMRPGDVEGIEIYRGASEVPAEFNRFEARCGVIVIWTRID
jgi:iron complex outermembrane receptor protein